MTVCSVPDCGLPNRARNLCNKHYQAARIGTIPLPPRVNAEHPPVGPERWDEVAVTVDLRLRMVAAAGLIECALLLPQHWRELLNEALAELTPEPRKVTR